MDLLVSEHGRVLHITLNRPQKRNALTWHMCCGIVHAIASAQRNRDIGCILITAAGQVFCAGMDLDEAVDHPGADLAALHDDLFNLGATSMKPIVVSVNGAALGAGLGLVAQGHVVMAAQGAVFGLPEIRIGSWPFMVYRAVEAALGARRTLELSLVGSVFPAHDALIWGLVHYVCPPAEAAERAQGLARDLAKASPLAIQAGMRYFHESRGKSSKEAGERAAALRVELMAGDDFREGCASFKEKRDPRWPSMPKQFYSGKAKHNPEK